MVELDHDHLTGVDFSHRKRMRFSAVGSVLEGCRFNRTGIRDALFGAGGVASEYIECSFDGARIRFGPGGYARFVRCSLRDVVLRDWFCFAVELVDCTFSGKPEGAFFNGTVPEEKRRIIGRSRNEFIGNDFSAMALIDVGFRTGVDLTEQRLPSGPEYLYVADAAEAVERARAQIVSWEDLVLRQPAMTWIRILESEVGAGQGQLFLRPSDYHSILGEASVEAVVALLRE